MTVDAIVSRGPTFGYVMLVNRSLSFGPESNMNSGKDPTFGFGVAWHLAI